MIHPLRSVGSSLALGAGSYKVSRHVALGPVPRPEAHPFLSSRSRVLPPSHEARLWSPVGL